MAKEELNKKPVEVVVPPRSHSDVVEREGLLGGAVSLSTHLSERAMRSAFSFAREARNEVSDRVLAAVDWVDETQQAMLRLTRRITERTSGAAGDLIDAGEDVSLGLVRITRDTSNGLTDLVKRALAPDSSDRPTQPRANA